MASVIRGSDNFDSSSALPLGEGQTWQNVAGSRSENVWYTNDTGRPIMVQAACADSGSANYAVFYLSNDGGTTTVAQWFCANSLVGGGDCFVVPDGVSYKFYSAPSGLSNWNELR